MGDPFQPFIYGQTLFPMKIAAEYGIKIVFAGENAMASMADPETLGINHILILREYEKTWFSNYAVNFWLNKGYSKSELQLIDSEVLKKGIRVSKNIFMVTLEIGQTVKIIIMPKNTNFTPNLAH